MQATYNQLVRQLTIAASATSSRAIEAQQYLQGQTQNNPQIHQLLYQILIDPTVQYNTKILASVSLNTHLINIVHQTPYNELFSFARQIIRDTSLDHTYFIQLNRFFVELISLAQQNYTQQWLFLFKDLIAQKLTIKALTLMVYFTVSNVKDSDFIYFISMAVPWGVKEMAEINNVVMNSYLLLEWSKTMCEVLTKLLGKQDEVWRENVMMITRDEDIAKLILRVYEMESDTETGYLTTRHHIELNILKGSICELHGLLVQIYKQTNKSIRQTPAEDLLVKTVPGLSITLLLVAKDYDKYNQVFQCSNFTKNILKLFANALATIECQHIFSMFAHKLINQVVIPALVFTESELDSFENNCQEFVFYIEDIIDKRESDTLKSLALNLFEQLCDSVPGVLTHYVNLAVNAIKENLGIVERKGDGGLSTCQALVMIGALGYCYEQRVDMAKMIGEFLAFNSEVILKTLSSMELAVLYIILDYIAKEIIFPEGDYTFVYLKHASICRVHSTTQFTALSFLSSQISTVQSLELLQILLERTQNCGYGLVWTILQQYVKHNLPTISQPTAISLVNLLLSQIQHLRLNPTQTSNYTTMQCINIIREICDPKANYLKAKGDLRSTIFLLFRTFRIQGFKNVDDVIDVLNDFVKGRREIDEVVYGLFPDIDLALQGNEGLYLNLFPFINTVIMKGSFEKEDERLLKVLEWCLKPLGFQDYRESERAESLLLLQLFLDKYLPLLQPANIIQTMSLLNQYTQKPNQPPSILRLYTTNILFYTAPISFPKLDLLKKLLSLDLTKQGYSSIYMKKLIVIFLFKIMYVEPDLQVLSLVLHGIVKILVNWNVRKEVKSQAKKDQIKSYNLDEYKESVLKLNSPYKRIDIFSYFAERVMEMKGKNGEAFGRIVETLGEETREKMKKVLGLRQMGNEEKPRQIFKVRGVKEEVVFEEKEGKMEVDEEEEDMREEGEEEKRGVQEKKEKKKVVKKKSKE